jgi:anaerobic selenocysteine-containing dehydrogenase
MQHVYNSSGHDLDGIKRARHNPAFMHPDDLARLGVVTGDTVEIISERASIVAIVSSDDTLRPGLVSMTHAYGDAPDRDGDIRTIGSNVGRLLSTDDMQPYTGQPRMSNVAVAVRPTSIVHRDEGATSGSD